MKGRPPSRRQPPAETPIIIEVRCDTEVRNATVMRPWFWQIRDERGIGLAWGRNQQTAAGAMQTAYAIARQNGYIE